MAEIYESLPVEDIAKKSARDAAESLNSYLDWTTSCAFNGETITRRRLLDVFMYGNLAHANDDKRQTYEKWMQAPILAAIFPTFFEQIIAELTNCILSFREMNERTIHQLENGGNRAGEAISATTARSNPKARTRLYPTPGSPAYS